MRSPSDDGASAMSGAKTAGVDGDDTGAGAVEGQAAAPSARPGQERFLTHLAMAGEHVAAKRYREAEVEVLRALSGLPADLRALNLLALVRFKLGRLEEARATYREIAQEAPNDASVRRNLGLLALKLERIDEAIPELEMAARLAPTEPRAWSYLGYAYAKKGDAVAAAVAFRRAGQDALAAELELAATSRRPSGGVVSAPPGAAPPVVEVARAPAAPAASAISPSAPPAASPPGAPATAAISATSPAPAGAVAPAEAVDATPVSLVSFVLSRLGLAVAPPPPRGAALRLTVDDEAHLRADATLAAAGIRWEPAFRRVQGRKSGAPLGTGRAPFYRAVGPGEVWVAGAPQRWMPLALEDDVLYVREDRVLAFEGTLSWEAGAIPGDGTRMLQFRGRGCVVLELDGPPAAVKVTDARPVLIASNRLVGWIGRLVAHKQHAPRTSPLELACEGDGVLLFNLQ
jgi:Flp pilus assembly protein TadD/uncharacterized protein (AIM24 family)